MQAGNLLDRARRCGFRHRALRARAAAAVRAPLVLVPPLVVVRGDARARAAEAVIGRAPGRRGPWSSLVGYLEDVGGYRLGVDLHLFDDDLGGGVARSAAALARFLVERRGGSVGTDVIGLGSGALVPAYLLAARGRELPERPAILPAPGAHGIRRLVLVGPPHAGTLQALAVIRSCARVAAQAAFDLLPGPEAGGVVDEAGGAVRVDLFDPAAWATHALAALPVDALAERLEAARQVRRVLARRGGDVDLLIIGTHERPTRAAVPLDREGRLRAPAIWAKPGRDEPEACFGRGDGAVLDVSMLATPRAEGARVWWAPAGRRGHFLAQAETHRFVLEAVLAAPRAGSQGASEGLVALPRRRSAG